MNLPIDAAFFIVYKNVGPTGLYKTLAIAPYYQNVGPMGLANFPNKIIANGNESDSLQSESICDRTKTP